MTGSPCGKCGVNDWQGMKLLGVLDGILFFVCKGCGSAVARTFFNPGLTSMSHQAAERWDYLHELQRTSGPTD